MQSDMIWSRRRRWLGNLIPFAVASVAFGVALLVVSWLPALVVSLIVLHQSINQWGFYENELIQAELEKATGKKGELVGFVYEIPPDALDAHAEVGLLKLSAETLEIECEERFYRFSWNEVQSVERSMNIHSLIFLGGWIRIAIKGEAPLRLESRKFKTMWASKKRTNQLFEEIKKLAPFEASNGDFSSSTLSKERKN